MAGREGQGAKRNIPEARGQGDQWTRWPRDQVATGQGGQLTRRPVCYGHRGQRARRPKDEGTQRPGGQSARGQVGHRATGKRRGPGGRRTGSQGA
jgi:hypothetical protein